MIYHLLTPDKLKENDGPTHYGYALLQKEPFLHCCTKEQIPYIIERFYADAEELMVMEIDEEILDVELKNEVDPVSKESFPHIYGLINKTAIQRISPWTN
ncbi:MAG: DUF952 domain-containing protein [Spirochaetales bacterium]|nr:DUF952 domain-containing protein [Spirochaetales bacterium]